jgi:hypothetical protein
MFSQRKKEINPKKPRTPRPPHGIVFPTQEDGTTSTSKTGADTISAALFAGSQSKQLAEAAGKAGKKWRFGYLKHFTNMVKESSKSKNDCLAIAEAGLDYMHNNFKFVPNVGDEPIRFVDQMKSKSDIFHIGTVEGTGELPDAFEVPYKGKTLSGKELQAAVNKWVSYGTIEPDCGDAINALATNEQWRNLKGQTFVMIGASSAMGPFLTLLKHGATVVALDVPNKYSRHPNLWKYLVETAKKSPGKLIFPLDKPQAELSEEEMYKAAGIDLLVQPAEILNFLLKDDVVGKVPFTIGNYTYLDGELHVKLSLCSDAIMKGLIEKRGTAVSLAFLCTPTDLMPIPKEAYDAAVANRSFGARPLGFIVEKLMQLLTGKPVKNGIKLKGEDKYLVDGIIVAQGPNYALAKRLQHWRAMWAFEKGCKVSTNIAPSTATLSVTSNITFKWAYGGMPYFTPFEIFYQETTNAVMTALLIHDVRNPAAPSDPANKSKHGIESPLDLFKFGSFHGGLWRCGYKANSIGEISVLIHFLGGPVMFLPVTYALLAVFGYVLSSPMVLESAIFLALKADVATAMTF